MTQSGGFSLTAEQERLVNLRDGAYLVVAPPGSGKTEVLAQRIVRLVQTAPAESFRVLALSFTKSAAAAMRRRAAEHLGEFTKRVVCTTYHSFCVDLLRSYGALIGLADEFTLYESQEDRIQALALGLADEGLISDVDGFERSAAIELLDAIGRLKRDMIPPDAAPAKPVKGQSFTIADAYKAYELALSLHSAVDFDGVIVKACELLNSQPDVCQQYRLAYRYILIDEAQDTSAAQYALLRALCGSEHRNVFVVADPAQSIYSFAGASSKYIERFQQDFRAERFKLTITFRCAEAILRHARPLLPGHGSDGARRPLQRASAKGLVVYREYDDEVSEARAVVEWVSKLSSGGLPREALAAGESTEVSPEQIAVLARSRNALRAVLDELNRRGIAHHFSTGDAGLFDTEEYTAILYGIKVLASGQDPAIVRSLVACLRQTATGDALGDYDDVVGDAPALFRRLSAGLQGSALAAAIDVLADAATESGAGIAGYVERLLKWDAMVSRDEVERAELLAGDKDILHQRWVSYRNRPESAQRGWHGLLLELVTSPRPEADGFRVLTVHAAKGLEFKAVALVGLNDGAFPDFRNLGPSELDDEKRLLYVALTRASRLAFLTRPRFRLTRFGLRPQIPSRFLSETGL